MTPEDCLKQAQEYIEIAKEISDPKLRDNYLKLAQHLTLLAAALEENPNVEVSRRDSGAGTKGVTGS